jgi:phage-related protein
MARLKKLPARFYRSTSGNEPVREWLKQLDSRDRKLIGMDIAIAEYGWPVGMPLARAMGDGLFELRTHLESGRIARVLFSVAYSELILLHAFIKKTQRTPQRELNLALQRLKEIR